MKLHMTMFHNGIGAKIRDRQDVFSGIFAYSFNRYNLASGREVHYAEGSKVSGQFFETLGIQRDLILKRHLEFPAARFVSEFAERNEFEDPRVHKRNAFNLLSSKSYKATFLTTPGPRIICRDLEAFRTKTRSGTL
jgi:hypothetical protein